MRILITAGNTQSPVDAVRCITNIFTGKTGAHLAKVATVRGHAVRLLTSHPETLADAPEASSMEIRSYRTFADLRELLPVQLREFRPEAVIHAAAISDYEVVGIYSSKTGEFRPETAEWPSGTQLRSAAAGKVKSDHAELWLRMTPTPKLIDCFRTSWGFRGVLVKFKLEVGLDEAALLTIAEASRRQSGADLMVANTLEGKDSWAMLGPLAGEYLRLSRQEMVERLLKEVEALHLARGSAGPQSQGVLEPGRRSLE